MSLKWNRLDKGMKKNLSSRWRRKNEGEYRLLNSKKSKKRERGKMKKGKEK